MTPIPSGRRRHKVRFNYRSAPVTDLESTPTYTPSDGTYWYAIEPLSAREILLAQQSQDYSEVTHRLTGSYVPNFPKHQDQILFGDRIFEIVGDPLNTEEANRQLVYMAIERDTTNNLDVGTAFSPAFSKDFR
jgi:hypothetical protein